MIIDDKKAMKILTGIQKYCKDKTWCLACPLGRDECDELFGVGVIPSGWEINLKAPKKIILKGEVVNMSNANKMKELAGIFGLELGEEFNIVHDGKYPEYNPYVFTGDGLLNKDGECSPVLTLLLRGVYTVEKLPFRPKEGQLYYTFGYTLNVISIHWAGCKYDMERKMLGIVFRTELEAIEYLPIYSKRLRGEEE